MSLGLLPITRSPSSPSSTLIHSYQCYIGKKRLEAGIAQYRQRHPGSTDTFTTTWHPFYLNPHAPRQSVDKRQAYAAKFGGPERADAIFERITAAGAGDGIRFSFSGRTGNTRDSHRLLQLAGSKSEAAQTRTVEQLFAAYFELEKDITSHEVLAAAGKEAGLEEAEVKRMLESDEFGDVVDKEVAEARSEAVSGVPHFTLQNQYEVSGAQEPAAFVRLFERIKARESAGAAAI